MGDESHRGPGIAGWCRNEADIIKSPEDLEKIIEPDKKYCLVCQTTFNLNTFEEILRTIETNNYSNIVVHNTICDATRKRQEACVALASKSDVMLIIGGRNSSNTKKLYELSKDLCENTFLIQNYKEIPYNYIDKNTIVGVSAGASTPDWVIEEVISMLENLNDKVNEMNEDAEKTEILEETLETDKVDLAEEKAEEGEPAAEAGQEPEAVEKTDTMHDLLENYGGVADIRTGDKVKGTVIYVSPDAVSVNINYKSDGIITREEFSLTEVSDLREEVKEGDEIEALVAKISDQDGNVVLTRKPLEEQKIWDELEQLRIKGEIAEVPIIEASQHGIYGVLKGIKGFIPRNQISINRNVDPSEYVGKNIKVKILETKNKKGRRQLVLTSRAVEKLEKEAKEKEAWENIQEGEIYEGTVKIFRITVLLLK